MKSILLLVAIMISSQAFAVVGEAPVRRMNAAESRARVESSRTLEDILKMQRDPNRQAELLSKIDAVVKLNLKNVVSLDGVHQTALVKMVNIAPLEVLAEVARLASVAKDPTVSAKEKQMAISSLELMADAASNVSGITHNSAEAQAQKAKVIEIIEVSNKISALDFGNSSKQFVEKYQRALREGKSVKDAVKEASNGKFTEAELRDCE